MVSWSSSVSPPSCPLQRQRAWWRTRRALLVWQNSSHPSALLNVKMPLVIMLVTHQRNIKFTPSITFFWKLGVKNSTLYLTREVYGTTYNKAKHRSLGTVLLYFFFALPYFAFRPHQIGTLVSDFHGDKLGRTYKTYYCTGFVICKWYKNRP